MGHTVAECTWLHNLLCMDRPGPKSREIPAPAYSILVREAAMVLHFTARPQMEGVKDGRTRRAMPVLITTLAKLLAKAWLQLIKNNPSGKARLAVAQTFGQRIVRDLVLISHHLLIMAYMLNVQIVPHHMLHLQRSRKGLQAIAAPSHTLSMIPKQYLASSSVPD
jgi:hypothetical protein